MCTPSIVVRPTTTEARWQSNEEKRCHHCRLRVGLWKVAFAYRIDEYLQATMLSLEGNRVQASMRLIPGIVVSPSITANIDSDGDGAFSASEEHAYAQRVLDDLTITIDAGVSGHSSFPGASHSPRRCGTALEKST
jgi:hypothetical protein